MSIRTTLIGGATLLLLVVFASFSGLAIWSINHSVVREAQARVDRNLLTLGAYLAEQEAQLARLLVDETAVWSLSEEALEQTLRRARSDLGLTVLNACAADGRALAGSYASPGVQVPVQRDAILRQALEGRPAHGTVVLDAARLELEGGSALRRAMAVQTPAAGDHLATSSALFWWVAKPLFGPSGRVEGLIYGGRALNHHTELVDRMRDMLFGSERLGGKPLGTVTLFLDGVRVATNVLGPDGARAEGTLVSDEVRQRVMQQGQIWRDRAWVVDASYLSGYRSLVGTDGRAVGMVYVGLLEAPYLALKRELVLKFAAPGLAALALVLVLTSLVIRRLVHPLSQLGRAAEGIAEASWEQPIDVGPSFVEVNALGQAFARMRAGLLERDRALQDKASMLEQLNTRLQRTNTNYMEMLGFVTHELRSPVAAMQSLADTLGAGLAGPLPAKAQELTSRISRNAEELQDMVRDYLALSRLERGELEARMREVELVHDVIHPAVEQTRPLLEARDMELRLDLPPAMQTRVDPDLLRIALVNFLSNAAKYGRQGGPVELRLVRSDAGLILGVHNAGEGFTDDEAPALFQKFTRLRNDTTRGQRGSGLGLYLCAKVAALHGGRAWAQAQAGAWAEFNLELPRAPGTGTHPAPPCAEHHGQTGGSHDRDQAHPAHR